MDKLNQHYEDLISNGDFSGDDYDRVSSILGQIYKNRRSIFKYIRWTCIR